MSKTQRKKCWVCGDNALGRNFGVITCESCKAFFRRNALKTSVFHCKTYGKCVINVENRKSCPKCRLNKCLAIGMKKELIMTKNHKQSCDSSDSESYKDVSIDSNNSSPIDSTLFDPEFDALFENCCLSEQQINEEIMQIEESLNESMNSFDLEKVNEMSDYSVVSVVRPIATFNKVLNDIELSRLEELSSAEQCLQLLNTPLTQNIIEYSTIREYFKKLTPYKFEEFAKQFVKYCKKLSSFKELCEDDQLCLVKKGYLDSSMWQHIKLFNFDDEYMSFYFDQGYSLRMPLNLFKKEKPNIYEITKRFFRSLGSQKTWVLDPTIRNLLTMISLFNPNRPNLTHQHLVRLKQQMYLYLLQRYLIQKFSSESESMEVCSKIMTAVQECTKISVVMKEFDKHYIEFMTPLLREFIE